MTQHPLQHLAWIGRELHLQQFVPHLFLAPAQIYDRPEVIGTSIIRRIIQYALRHDRAAEQQQVLNRPQDIAAAPEKVAEIDKIVMRPDPGCQPGVQILQPLRLAVDRSDSPG
jgi:hypothetical protein